ncbi:thioredoxin family protein [Saccharicrinis aurantiacus]|uniref:thioredoxin family protein n=1 Tax=Saccharicrinis aurantiacus TaxID=1849719 RepID=UPI0024932FFD|nr:thioredoxin family protein [Saccharicrinis aurantiacus]
MKKLLILSAAILFSIVITAQTSSTSGITFENAEWSKVLAKAKAENKPIFIDISTSWCGYCKKMKTKTFTDSEVGKFYNKEFINVSFDAEKGDGIALAEKYKVNGYPTFVYLNPDGSLAEQTSGYRNAEEFIKVGQLITK